MPTELHDNVFFVGVARLAVQAMVIASLPYNLRDIDLGGVRQVLQQPNMNMSPGKHYSFNVDSSGMAWHLIAGKHPCFRISPVFRRSAVVGALPRVSSVFPALPRFPKLSWPPDSLMALSDRSPFILCR